MPSAIGKTLRIASASGSVTDRRHGFATLAKEDDVSFIIGDWMSEYNMTTRGGAKVNGAESTAEYEQCFLESIVPALPDLAKRGIKVAVNAGGSDTKKLHDVLLKIVQDLGLNLRIAWIEGDEVSNIVSKSSASGNPFRSLTTGSPPILFQLTVRLIFYQEKIFQNGDSSPSMHRPILGLLVLWRP
jgi:hypothetical protein